MSQAMERLKSSAVQEAAATPVGQAMLERGQTVQQMRLDNYMTAVQVQAPRDKRRVIKEVEFEAELLGEKAYYSWTAKGKGGRSLVEGASIDLAMVMLREWGNCAARADLVQETGTHYLFDGIFLDLERGVTVVRQYRQVKSRDMGKMDKDRAEDIVFQVGQSKAMRNAVLVGVPQWLQDKALRKAKTAAAKRLTPDKVVDAFSKWSVDQKALERRVGKGAKRWDEMDIAELRGVYQAILDGVTSVDNEFATEIAETAVAAAVQSAAVTREKVDPETGEVTQGPENPAEPGAPQQEKAADPPPAQSEPEAPKEPTAAAKKAVEAFSAVGVSQEQLEEKLDQPATNWKRGDLNRLKAMLQSIKDGDVQVGVLFGGAEPAEQEDEGGSWD